MEVARLRSCYSVPCVFFQDGTQGTLQWYFVPEGTPVLPFGTVFQSDFWSDQPEGESWPLGEVPGATRTWTDGTAPYPVAGGPACGTADQFANGDPTPRSPILNVYGGLACCPTPPAPFIGACTACFDGGVWSDYTLVVSGATGIYLTTNGTFRLRYVGSLAAWPGCNWLSDTSFVVNFQGVPTVTRWAIQSDAAGSCTFGVTLFVPNTGFGPRYPMPGYDFFSRVSPTLNQQPPEGGYAPLVFVVPGFLPAGFPPCPNLATTVGAYQFTIAPLPSNPVQIRPRGGTWPLEATGQCQWAGEIAFMSPGSRGTPIFVPMTLTVAAGGVAIVRISLSVMFAGRADLLYVSNPGWNGIAPTACMLTSGASVFVNTPLAITLQVQGS